LSFRHEQLWAPWRLEYIQGESPQAADNDAPLPKGADPVCFICTAAASPRDREHRVVDRGQTTLTIINRYPYNNGHLMVAPIRHVSRLDLLTSAERLECLDQMARMVALLERLLKSEGFNLGLNLGKIAGAGLPGHLHWHIVPRWSGDTNFMPVLAGIRTIPQSLDALWEAVREAIAQDHESP
jgi:ATP adenylyltransferase